MSGFIGGLRALASKAASEFSQAPVDQDKERWKEMLKGVDFTRFAVTPVGRAKALTRKDWIRAMDPKTIARGSAEFTRDASAYWAKLNAANRAAREKAIQQVKNYGSMMENRAPRGMDEGLLRKYLSKLYNR